MSEAPEGYIKIEDGEFYQNVAAQTQNVVFGLMNQLAFELARGLRPDIEDPVGVDGGALLGGAIGGILQFAVSGGSGDPDGVRQQIIDQMDVILPQIAMQKAMDDAGSVGVGRA